MNYKIITKSMKSKGRKAGQKKEEGSGDVTDLKKTEHAELFQHARTAVEEINKVIEDISHSDEATSADELYSAGIVQILNLKRHHRALCEVVEGLREETAGVKSELDTSSLHLQNLLYEKQHYQREIQACRSYTSQYTPEELELVSEEEYLTLKEAEVKEEEEKVMEDVEEGEQVMDVEGKSGESGKEEMEVEEVASGVEDAAHQLMIDRLKHEVERRKTCLGELAALKSERDSIASDLAKKRNILNSIHVEVSKLKEHLIQSMESFEKEDQTQLSHLASEFVPHS